MKRLILWILYSHFIIESTHSFKRENVRSEIYNDRRRNIGPREYSRKVKRRRIISEKDSISRNGRFFNLFTIIRFLNLPCVTSSGRNGTCFAEDDCSKEGGVIEGYCASGFGVCCRLSRECGETITDNGTYFSNPISTQRICKVIVKRSSDEICQIRLNFEKFDVLGPNWKGECSKDFFLVNDGRKIPKLCGSNSGQHVILSAGSGSAPTQLSMILDTTVTIQQKRKWHIKILQYECSNSMIAPTGCLQYHTGSSGIIESFNYRKDSQSIHLARLHYSICIRSEESYCSISYSQPLSDPYSFTLSKNATGLSSSHRGSLAGDRDCRRDYLMIPGGSGNKEVESSLKRDRYCGTSLGFCVLEVDSDGMCLIQPGTVISHQRPFVVGVVTDGKEDGTEESNSGFSLNYRQLPCSF